jgi:hypothetical protein
VNTIVCEISHLLWNESVLDLLQRCSEAKSKDADGLTRALFAVVAQAPETVRDYLDINLDRSRFDKLVELGALECAVLQIYGANLGFMMSRSPEGLAAASLSCLGVEGQETACGGSLPIAMISCMCLVFTKHFAVLGASPLKARLISTD